MDLERISQAFGALVELMAKLRGPGGCPWDAKQTENTLKVYLLEECYEVLEAIEKGSPDKVCEELGDLLFQIVFLARIASEKQTFDLLDVIEGITEKMIHRHPHVFGDTRVAGADEVALHWSEIKRRELGPERPESTLLENVPEGLPALMRAHRITERAHKLGFGPAQPIELWDRVEERFQILKEAVMQADTEAVGNAIGHILFSLADLARLWRLNAETLLRRANQEFISSFKERETEG